ncbi:MAG TPA: HAMP domain-containing sensor histidine kinase [Solirubrobacteraceae bacterium]|nr:HAMP domain-containing sensor histidine kinase [Solirubrobacteraceae bacterium]
MILCGFAVIVGVLTTRQIHEDFKREVETSADRIVRQAQLEMAFNRSGDRVVQSMPGSIDLADVASSTGAAIRVITKDDYVGYATTDAPDFGPPLAPTAEIDGWRVETRNVLVSGEQWALQYARRISEIQDTANRVKVFLAFGVLGGALLSLLAGLAVARRAMEPIAELTAAAHRIERSRDPTEQIPHPEAEDEVSELARTLEAMLASLDAARSETEGALLRQREFVADASHELRTPLTSVLANLELLEEELTGEQREAAASALRSSRRMRRLVADLLLLARADAGRKAPHMPVDLSEVVTDAASELEPVAGDHEISIDAPAGARVDGARDELHRLVLNLMENALRHTDPGTAVEATVERRNGEVVLSVEDDGPGIPIDQREKVFERFYRGSGEHSGSSGLGLSIVRAVVDSHGGTVQLEEPLDGRGARFVVRIPAA